MERVALVTLAVGLVLGAPLALMLRALPGRREFGSSSERAVNDTLHTASLVAPHLRGGLTPLGAQRSGPALRDLLGTPAVALTAGDALLHWDGDGEHHTPEVPQLAAASLADGRTRVLPIHCRHNGCPVQQAVVAPLTECNRVVGTLIALAPAVSPALLRAAEEVAGWVNAQLALAELTTARARLAEAEVRALRAQISPHFIYNSLTAIASFVRTDPERARELLLEFAEFTRYSFRRHGQFTTLAEELRSIDRYLLLERARFGERLQVVLRVAPEVLPVAVPFLCLQPLVENAVKHGLEQREGQGRITIIAEDAGAEARISVEDDGAGMNPADALAAMVGGAGDSVGLGNVDERLRGAFGDAYGLVIETAIGAGTKISVRVPKYAVNVRAV